MNRNMRIYLIAIITIAVVLLPLQHWSDVVALGRDDLVGLVSLVGLAILSETLSVRAMVGTYQMVTSIAFIPYFAAVMLFPPAAAVAAVVATSLITQMVVHKRPPLRGLFNASQSTIALMVAALIFHSVGGPEGSNLRMSLVPAVMLLARVTALSVTFFFVNQILVGVAIALNTGTRFRTTFSRIVAPSGANLLYDVLVSPIAIVVAVLYSSFGSGGLVIGVLPMLIIRHSVQSTVKLQQANKDLLSVLVKTIE
ncbi:MAG TPA: hypothetical protein VM100_10415, partial [Longimicrobiales bacterium]|nr:hypothetical protein [Longimicrobiales bacterium]